MCIFTHIHTYINIYVRTGCYFIIQNLKGCVPSLLLNAILCHFHSLFYTLEKLTWLWQLRTQYQDDVTFHGSERVSYQNILLFCWFLRCCRQTVCCDHVSSSTKLSSVSHCCRRNSETSRSFEEVRRATEGQSGCLGCHVVLLWSAFARGRLR
jgi:hypothetical protein